MASIIEIKNLGKKYHLNTARGYLSLRDTITRKFSQFFSSTNEKELFWALNDISLTIQAGERIGIIGRNGAGKSTLLKIISRITPPTTGSVSIDGRVASLLEVGTGFHPELTGRENIFFNGSILGLRKKEINQRFDEIIAFSGIEKFIDTPLKYYSSGMQLRLAFSVAAHLNPEILLIDEVLAVGDMEFQKKCIGKMEEVSTKEGRTILFVSHNLAYLSGLCTKGVLLDKGKLLKAGPLDEVIQEYTVGLTHVSSAKTWQANERPGNEIVRLNSVRVISATGTAKNHFDVNEPVGIEMTYQVFKEGHVLWLGHNVHNVKGENIFDTHSVNTELYDKPHAIGIYVALVWIPENLLNTGSYIVSSAIFNHLNGTLYFHEKDILLFHVQEVFHTETARGMSPGDFPGMIRPLLQWTIEKY